MFKKTEGEWIYNFKSGGDYYNKTVIEKIKYVMQEWIGLRALIHGLKTHDFTVTVRVKKIMESNNNNIK